VYTTLKQAAFEANLALPKNGLINLTFGNASVLDRDNGVFAIKPSGVPYNELRWENMVIVDLDGNKIEGGLNPSSDTPTHRNLYLAFEGITGIVHTHSSHATSFAQAGKEIPILGTTHADYFPGNVPVTRIMTNEEILGGAYEWETGNVIRELFSTGQYNYLDYSGVLINRHAPFTWGTTIQYAVEASVALEYIAYLAFMSKIIHPEIVSMDGALIEKHFKRKHGKGAYYGQGLRPTNT